MPTITAFDWVPPFARGQVRDLRVRWALEEVGQPYDVHYLSQGEQKTPQHRAHQPFGQVPTYHDGDLTLFESGAIVMHIADTYQGLLPPGSGARAKALQWAFAALNSLEPAMMDRSFVTIFEADKPWSEARRPSVEARIHDRLKDLSARLGARPWLEGDSFMVGDLLMASVLRIIEGEGLVEVYDNLARYVARATARPAFTKALADQMAGFTGKAPPQWLEREAKMREAQKQGEEV